MLSLYCSECTVNLHENFISILGDMLTLNEFPADADVFGLAYLSSFEILALKDRSAFYVWRMMP